MAVTFPYKLQVFLEDEVRLALKNVAHRKGMTLQALVTEWLLDKLAEEPEGRRLTPARPHHPAAVGD